MGTKALALIVGLAFLWSIVLFVLAIFQRNRDQEIGFGYSLCGAIAFGLTYCDRLPGESLAVRDLVLRLPGIDEPEHAFRSSVLALVLLAVIYSFRVAIFVRLFLLSRQTSSPYGGEDAVEERLNDAVAPALAFLTFLVAIMALLRGAYDLGPVAVIALVTVILSLYYLRAFKVIVRSLIGLFEAGAVLVMKALRGIRRIPFFLILLVARLEAARRTGDSGESALEKWAEARWRSFDDEERKIRINEENAFRRAADRLNRSRNRR